MSKVATKKIVSSKAAKAKTIASEKDQFRDQLVLNAWMIREFGIDPLQAVISADSNGRRLLPIRLLGESIIKVSEGTGPDNLHYFYHAFTLLPQAKVTRADLLRYEENIVRHTAVINAQRSRKISWKYFQWLTLLFVEHYLDRYFHHRLALLDSLNAFVPQFNAYRSNLGLSTVLKEFSAEELNRICLQNATGSGKTLLMHMNLLQFRHVAKQARKLGEYTRAVLLTPGEDLTEQHLRELHASGIAAGRFFSADLLSQPNAELAQVDALEMSKLGEVDKENIVAVRNLGDSNLLLVDEGHVGLGSQNESGWLARRDALSHRGFVFEYSATFAQAIAAAKDDGVLQAYAKSVLFDYSYRYFYEDGYGKDYRIFNLPSKSSITEDTQRLYLIASLLSYYQQLRLFEEKQHSFSDFHLEKPLWVFVGASVTKAMGGSKEDVATTTDVALIVNFFAEFLHNRSASIQDIDLVLNATGAVTGLLNEDDEDIFSSAFAWLKEKRISGLDAATLYQDLLKRLFQHAAGGELHLTRVKGDTAEIRLHVGTSETPFGVINVGDAPALMKVLQDQCPHAAVIDSEFAAAGLFANISASDSSVNLLIGSRKFVAGWDCWRVSTLGLMHVGKSEGAQIIQLFGRGVRLKGYQWSLKRSNALAGVVIPPNIYLLETLSVFGVKADYMQEFRKFLEQEELPGNEKKEVREIAMNLVYDFGKQLMMLGPKTKKASGREYNFRLDGPIPCIADVPNKLIQTPVLVDWYPRIESLRSKSSSDKIVLKESEKLNSTHIAFINWDAIWFELESYKRLRGWTNLHVPQENLQTLFGPGNDGWYTLLIPKDQLLPSKWSHVEVWQRIVLELLKRYIEAFYNHARKAFYEPRLTLKPLTADHPNLPKPDDVYQLITDASDLSLLADIDLLRQEINSSSSAGLLGGHGNLHAYKLGTHLYSPLLHVAKGCKISVSPTPLNDSEFNFVTDLEAFLESAQGIDLTKGCEVFLLRNRSRGGGIGFFEAGSFYPDFIFWIKREVKGKLLQHVAFIEPHGLIHEGAGSAKILFHQTIKEIESRVKHDAKSIVTLDSFIVTPTELRDLKWAISKLDEFADLNVLFMKDDKEKYVSRLMTKLLSSDGNHSS